MLRRRLARVERGGLTRRDGSRDSALVDRPFVFASRRLSIPAAGFHAWWYVVYPDPRVAVGIHAERLDALAAAAAWWKVPGTVAERLVLLQAGAR